MATKVTGGCQCGTVRYELTGEAQMLYVCHCLDCQRQSSSAFGMSLIVDPENVKYQRGEDSLKTWITRGEDGSIKKCAFCRICGTRKFTGTHTLQKIKVSTSGNREFLRSFVGRIDKFGEISAFLAIASNSANTCPSPALRRRFMKD